MQEYFEDQIDLLRTWIEQSKSTVFFGGAGVSTESGIPDFRSIDGLYHQQYKYPPETILSATFFYKNTKEFYEFYQNKMLELNVLPNAVHKKLALWEKEGKLTSIVTQNIDGLHQQAGSQRVWELHGSVYRNYCRNCNAFYDAQYIKNAKGIPTCRCNGLIKPDVVLYEEGLNSDILAGAIRDISEADVLIVGGTSLTVYPAAGLLDYYKGKRLVLINKTSTARDEIADLTINGSIGEIFASI